jgi:serine/threonine protein kinase
VSDQVSAPLDELFAHYVERHVIDGQAPDLAALCRERPDLLPALERRVARYEWLERTLDGPGAADAPSPEAELPHFAGFRTIERIGVGGAGEVYKLEDLALSRTVAAKILRRGGRLGQDVGAFLREARSLALFEDPRIVRVLEFRGEADPPVLLMDHVDGFGLDRIARALEPRQRARLMVEICEAIEHAHALGLQHRDLKPANILIDASLMPHILDFGLSGGESDQGHGMGTPAYMAPEQLDPSRPIDARTDVYALGVLLYEMLCGSLPFGGTSTAELIDAVRAGQPRLPTEVDPGAPEPLQAIALKAMEADPARRYASAAEMARDLRRYLDGRPVLARPSIYDSLLERRVRPHVEQIREWQRLALVHPHESERLQEAYRRLELHDDDWIIRGRNLGLSQIALYLGAFLTLCGGLLYFAAYQQGAIASLAGPAVVLGLPCLSLNVAAWLLHRRERRAVAVAFHLAGLVLLPLFVLIALQELGAWPLDVADARQLFGILEAGPSNRQLQLALGLAWVAALALAWITRTITLASAFAVLALLFHLALLGDIGLRGWLEQGRYDLLAAGLVPLLFAVGLFGLGAERRGRPWIAAPLYVAGALLLVAVLELSALDGRAFAHLGLSTAALAGEGDPVLLDTLAAMAASGILIYLVGRLLERRGTPLMRTPAWLLYTLSPFAILEPVAWLNDVGQYSLRFTWIYLALALSIALLSHVRQRRSFYYAGLVNTGAALWFVTDRYAWWDHAGWAALVVVIGLAVLGAGFALYGRERLRGPDPGS